MLAWMSKVRGETQYLAEDFTTYVDDYRVEAGKSEEAWRAEWRVGYIWQYLGLQYYSRNRSMEDQYGGPRRGTKFHIIYGYVHHITGEGKCTKTHLIIEKWLQRFTSEEPLEYKELKLIRGSWIMFLTPIRVAGHFWKEWILPWTIVNHTATLKDGNSNHMEWTMIWQMKIWDEMQRKIWDKLMRFP